MTIISGYAFSASYNCSLETLTDIERTVCDNTEISQLDDDLSFWYKELREENIRPLSQYKIPNLEENQRAWIRNRNSCSDEVCIKELYSERLLELKSLAKDKAKLTSELFLRSVLKVVLSDFEYSKAKNINEIIYSSVLFGERAEYLFKSWVSQGNSGDMCGAGGTNVYIYLKVDLSLMKVEEIQKMEAVDCGPGSAVLGHRIDSDTTGKLVITTTFSHSRKPVDAFEIKVFGVEKLGTNYWKSYKELKKYPGLSQ